MMSQIDETFISAERLEDPTRTDVTLLQNMKYVKNGVPDLFPQKLVIFSNLLFEKARIICEVLETLLGASPVIPSKAR